jgi:hypothetical protein
MIHEFDILQENTISEEKVWGAGAIDVSRVAACWEWQDHPDCTAINMGQGGDYVVRCRYKDFIDIWRTCTEKIDLNM